MHASAVESNDNVMQWLSILHSACGLRVKMFSLLKKDARTPVPSHCVSITFGVFIHTLVVATSAPSTYGYCVPLYFLVIQLEVPTVMCIVSCWQHTGRSSPGLLIFLVIYSSQPNTNVHLLLVNVSEWVVERGHKRHPSHQCVNGGMSFFTWESHGAITPLLTSYTHRHTDSKTDSGVTGHPHPLTTLQLNHYGPLPPSPSPHLPYMQGPQAHSTTGSSPCEMRCSCWSTGG